MLSRAARRGRRSRPSSRSTATCTPSTCSDEQGAEAAALPADPRELSFVKEALASIDKGGYAEALARVAFLMAHKDEPLPLSRLQLAHDLIEEYRELLPEIFRSTRRAVSAASRKSSRATNRKRRSRRCLCCSPIAKDRDRLLTLLERVLADQRVQRIQPSAEQKAMLARIRKVLGVVNRRPVASRRVARPTPGRVRVKTAAPRVALAKKPAAGAA